MPNFNRVAKEIFQICRSFDYQSYLFDENNTRVYEPDTARRFFIKPKNMLIAIIDDNENSSIRLMISKSLDVKSIESFRESLRMVANKYSMVFNIRQYSKEITPKDFSTTHSITEGKKMLEGMYGTSHSAYLNIKNVRMVAKLNEGRVEKIIIENDGKFVFPTNDLLPATAMTKHIANGGHYSDATGSIIIEMAKDYETLTKAIEHINDYKLNENAINLRNQIIECRKSMNKKFENDEFEQTEKKKISESSITDMSRYTGMSKQLSESVITALHNEDYRNHGDHFELIETNALLEFKTWVEGFDPTDKPKYEDSEIEEMCMHAMDEMNKEEFCFDYDLNSESTDKQIDSSIESYMEYFIEGHYDEIFDLYGYGQLFRNDIKEYIKNNPIDEDIELSDVLMPKNKGADLEDEVQKSAKETDRIKQLAGVPLR